MTEQWQSYTHTPPPHTHTFNSPFSGLPDIGPVCEVVLLLPSLTTVIPGVGLI